jgi:hypothetical protein
MRSASPWRPEAPWSLEWPVEPWDDEDRTRTEEIRSFQFSDFRFRTS